MLVVTLDLTLPAGAYGKITKNLEQQLTQARGVAEMQSRKPRMLELAAALQLYTKQNNKFPRGTVARELRPDRNGIPWRPDQRLSWMADLLPYLSEGEFRGLVGQLNPKNSWNEDENLTVAQALIPQFLSKDSDRTAWWVSYPGLPMPVGATHWVGMAGVGLDAAEYTAQDTSRIGIFGYDRETGMQDIKDGPANTIALIQVPATFKRPWLAGGGATIQGVPETESIKPFVSTEYNGKRGTFAIMADGKVRFIPETIADKDFQALCTIAGGEQVDVEKVAPLVAGQTELKPQLPADGKPAPKEEAKPLAPKEEPKPPAPKEGPKPPAPPAGVPPPVGAPVPPVGRPEAPAPKEAEKPAPPPPSAGAK
jgi:hypothetical protein